VIDQTPLNPNQYAPQDAVQREMCDLTILGPGPGR
jgi:hypothetical protein